MHQGISTLIFNNRKCAPDMMQLKKTLKKLDLSEYLFMHLDFHAAALLNRVRVIVKCLSSTSNIFHSYFCYGDKYIRED
jgi:hypothetical protein